MSKLLPRQLLKLQARAVVAPATQSAKPSPLPLLQASFRQQYLGTYLHVTYLELPVLCKLCKHLPSSTHFYQLMVVLQATLKLQHKHWHRLQPLAQTPVLWRKLQLLQRQAQAPAQVQRQAPQPRPWHRRLPRVILLAWQTPWHSHMKVNMFKATMLPLLGLAPAAMPLLCCVDLTKVHRPLAGSVTSVATANSGTITEASNASAKAVAAAIATVCGGGQATAAAAALSTAVANASATAWAAAQAKVTVTGTMEGTAASKLPQHHPSKNVFSRRAFSPLVCFL
jgi:hypothetical protein